MSPESGVGSPESKDTQSKHPNVDLVVNEIFYSIIGESSYQGLPAVFVRLAGCNLKCDYCDTEYSRSHDSATVMAIADITDEIQQYTIKRVLLTGGEPLLQSNSIILMRTLLDRGYFVLLETNGSVPVEQVPAGVIKIVDVKCPGSGEGESFLPANLKHLMFQDQIKFVLSDRADFDFALKFIRDHQVLRKHEILFSPAHGQLNPSELAGWILDSREDIYLNIQLQKIMNIR